MKTSTTLFAVIALLSVTAKAKPLPYDGPAWPDVVPEHDADAERFTAPTPKQVMKFDVAITSEVRKIAGTPQLLVNGRVMPIFWSCVNAGVRKDGKPKPAALPFNVCTVNNFYPHAIFPKTGAVDFNYVTRVADSYVATHPNCYFIWDIWPAPPKDWGKAHPDEICADDKGRPTKDPPQVNWSIGSDDAVRVMADQVAQVISWVEKSKYANRVIAYRISGGHTTEWLGWQVGPESEIDFSPAALAAFRAFAAKRYGEQFAQAHVPTRAERHAPDGRLVWNPRDHLGAVAYHEFLSERMAGALVELCRAAKKTVGGRKAVGSYYGYTMTMMGCGDGHAKAHYALKKVLDSGAVDFLCSPPDYWMRMLGEPVLDMKPFASIAAHGIMPVIEDDTRTHFGRWLKGKGFGQPITAFQSASMMRRNMGSYLCRGQPLYYYDLILGTGFNFPQAQTDGEALRRIQEKCVRRGVRRNAEIAVVLGETSMTSMPRMPGIMPGGYLIPAYGEDGHAKDALAHRLIQTGEIAPLVLERISRIGAPWDCVLAEDLADNPGDYKLYVFLSCASADEKFRAAVRKLEERECTLLWTYAAGYAKGIDGSTRNMSDLTGFDFSELKGKRTPVTVDEKGRTMGTADAKVAPLFEVSNADRVLARYADGGEPAVAMKRKGKALSVYSGVWQYSREFLGRLAGRSGVHRYVETDDPIEANDALFMIHARNAGSKRIRLPRKVKTVEDVFSGMIIARDCDSFEIDLPIHGTGLYYFEPDGALKVSSLGFDAEDSTEYVQHALDSGAKKVILDRQASPWVVRPLKVRSNTELVFEDGVELVAKRGEFKGAWDFLLDCDNVTNVTIRGLGEKGGICRMWKCDYRDQTKYSKAEWRCALRLKRVNGMLVENMTFRSTGGDGIMAGGDAVQSGVSCNCRNVIIRKCVCDDNYRQGISLCAAEHVLIEDTILSNTEGTAPAAGIDFEPDFTTEAISDVTLRNVVSKNNAGSGFELAFMSMDKTSAPVSLRLENCRAENCRRGIMLNACGDRKVQDGVRGKVVVEKCEFNRSGQGVLIHANPTDVVELTFRDCAISNNSADVVFESGNPFQGIPDGINFDGFTVFQNKERDWFVYGHPSFGPAAKSVRGKVEVVRPDGRRETVQLDEAWCARRLPVRGDGTVPPPIDKLPPASSVEVVDSCPGSSVDLSPVATAFCGTYLMFAEKGQRVTLTVREVPRGPKILATKNGTHVRLVADDGSSRFVKSFPATGYEPGEISFVAPVRGFYLFKTSHGDFRYAVMKSNVPIAIDVAANDYIDTIKGRPFSVWMQSSGGRPGMLAVTGDSYYRFRVSMKDPQGNMVMDNPMVSELVPVSFPSEAKDGLYEVAFAAAARPFFQLIKINGSGAARTLFLSREKYWRAPSIRQADAGSNAKDPDKPKELVTSPSTPVYSKKMPDGSWFLDYGRDAFGWLELRGLPAGRYRVVTCEMTNKFGEVKSPLPKSAIRCLDIAGVTDGKPVYRVPFKPDPVNTKGYDPKAPAVNPPQEKFGIVAPFRFVRVIEAPEGFSPKAAVRQMLTYPFDENAASFSCDDKTLEEVFDFCRYTIVATSFAGIYVDGDRERTPYEADAYINQLGHYAIDNDYAMARRSHEWLLDHATWPTEWKQHSIMMAWADWMWTGDNRSLVRRFDQLDREKLLTFLEREDGLLLTGGERGKGCVVPRGGDIVDWPNRYRTEFEFRPVNSVVNAFHYLNLVEMADLAKAIGRDARPYLRRAAKVRESYRKAFLDGKAGLVFDGEGSTHHSLQSVGAAVAFGLVDAGEMGRMADFLESKGVDCSVYFVQYLLEALFKAGRAEAAVKIMAGRGPRSWKRMMDFGTTMTLEVWEILENVENDVNHAWGTAALNVISRYVLGVTPAEPGFAKIAICPQLGGLKRVSGKVPTARGPVTVKAEGERLIVDTPAPATVTWRGKTRDVPSGHHEF